MTEIEARLAGGLARFVVKAGARPGWVIGVVAGITLALLPYIALNLGINSDHTKIISPDIPSQIAHAEFSTLFPKRSDSPASLSMSCMEKPTTGFPRRATRQAATELSTPPLMATAVDKEDIAEEI